jgi:Zn-finger nucleic acid-binding protein
MHEMEVDICPQCMGTWYDARELSRAAGLRFSDMATGAAMAGARRTERRCPSCALPLYEREIQRGSGIYVDQRANCSGVFLERDEFSRTQRYFRERGAAPLVRRPPVTVEDGPLRGQLAPDAFGALIAGYLRTRTTEGRATDARR